MPAKGTKLRTGDRLRLVNQTLYRRFKKENPETDISYLTFSTIINECNETSAIKVLDNISGYKMPEQMGYLAVTKFKPKRRQVDFNKTKQIGQTVYHTNFHSFGYSPHIQWFSSQITKCKFHQIYKFKPETKFSRGAAARMKAGKSYNEFNYTHFKKKKLRINLDKIIK